MPKEGHSGHLETFKALYKRHKTYWLMPAALSKDGSQLEPFPDLAIRKGKIFLRQSDEIGPNDIDRAVFPKDKEQAAMFKKDPAWQSPHKWTFGKSN